MCYIREVTSDSEVEVFTVSFNLCHIGEKLYHHHLFMHSAKKQGLSAPPRHPLKSWCAKDLLVSGDDAASKESLSIGAVKCVAV